MFRSGKKRSSVFQGFSVAHQVGNAYDILEMPTAWGNEETCHDLRVLLGPAGTEAKALQHGRNCQDLGPAGGLAHGTNLSGFTAI